MATTSPIHPSSQATAPTVQQTAVGNTVSAHTPQHSSACVAQLIPPLEGEREALAMENLLQACSSERPFSLELAGNRRVQTFLLRTDSPETLETLCQQVRAQYPQVQTHAVKPSADPLVLKPGEHALVGEFALSGPSWMPIKTFWNKDMSEEGTDPLPGILAAMENLNPGERIIAQLALVRAPDSWVNRYKRKSVEHSLQPERDAKHQPQGTPGDTANEVFKIAAGLFAFMGALQGYTWYRQHAYPQLAMLILVVLAIAVGLIWWWLHQEKPIYDQELVAEKLLRVAYYAQLRVIAIGPEQHDASKLRGHLTRMELAYRQFNLASANGFVLKKTYTLTREDKDAPHLVEPARAFKFENVLLRILYGGRWSKDVLNAREASGMYHLPQEGADLPLVQRLPTKRMLASPQVARQIECEPTATPPVLIGYSEQRGHKIPVYFPEAVLFAHKFFVARSRYGKSTLMQLLIEGAEQNIRPLPPGAPLPYLGVGKQPAVLVFDPHGDLVNDVMQLPITHQRKNDVLLIDLADTSYPCGINLLDASMGFTRDQAVANMMSSFSKAWSDFWGPRMAFYLSHVLLTLFCANEHLCSQGKRDQQYTLLDVNPVLQQPDYAREVISQLDQNNRQEMELLAWWRDTYFKLPDKGSFKQEIISPILSKMGVFSEKQVLQRIVGQPVTTVNIGEAIEHGKICLVSLASKELEEDAVGILGATLVNLAHRAMQAQSSLRLAERRRVFIAIDEFQNIPADYEKLLSEDGKYGCSMMLATQNLERLNTLKEGLLDIVLSNCEQLCAFSCSAADAEILEKELHERVKATHIMSQPRLHCYVRMAIPGQPLQIASLSLAKPGSWERSATGDQHERDIRDANRQRYQSAAQVDKLLVEHVNRYSDMQPYLDKVQRDTKKTQSAKNRRENERKKASGITTFTPTTKTSPTGEDTQGALPPAGALGTSEEQPDPGAQTAPAPSKKKRTRNHKRTKRTVKPKAIGLPPIAKHIAEAEQAQERKKSA